MKQEIEFLSPRFVGARFAEHSIPLEVLKDLAVFEEMVTEAARLLYLHDHTDRTRAPKGFCKGVSIVVRDINDGSAIPKLVLVFSTATNLALFPPPDCGYIEKARDAIVETIDAVEHDEAVDSTIEPVLSYFDRIGRSLKDDENIEFRPSTPDRPARLNRQTRKKLILASSKAEDYTEEIELVGLVSGSDHDKETFTLKLKDGSTVSGPKDRGNKRLILEAHTGYDDEQKVRVKGIGRFGRNGKLTKIESVDNVELLDKLDISERLHELGQLEKGWHDGRGNPLDETGLSWLEESFLNNYDDAGLPLPWLYPTIEGNVQAEWTIGDWEVSLEVRLNDKHGEYQAVNMDSGQQVDEEFDLTKAESWKSLNDRLLEMKEETDE